MNLKKELRDMMTPELLGQLTGGMVDLGQSMRDRPMLIGTLIGLAIGASEGGKKAERRRPRRQRTIDLEVLTIKRIRSYEYAKAVADQFHFEISGIECARANVRATLETTIEELKKLGMGVNMPSADPEGLSADELQQTAKLVGLLEMRNRLELTLRISADRSDRLMDLNTVAIDRMRELEVEDGDGGGDGWPTDQDEAEAEAGDDSPATDDEPATDDQGDETLELEWMRDHGGMTFSQWKAAKAKHGCPGDMTDVEDDTTGKTP